MTRRSKWQRKTPGDNLPVGVSLAVLVFLVPGVLSGCGWSVPRPSVPLDAVADAPPPAPDAGPDGAVADLPVADLPTGDALPDTMQDAPVGTDLPAMDARTDGPLDGGEVPEGAVTPDATGDGAADGGPDGGADAMGAMDTTVDGGPDAVVEAGADALGDAAGVCTPGARRPCYTGSAASRDVGVCRDGVQVCDATGAWPAACAGQIVPDCANRACGSDGCGGTCGPCAGTTVCDEAGRCVTRTCGPEGFTMACPDGSHCPTGSSCVTGGSCACNPGYVAVDCTGATCSPCTYPTWLCVPAPFCAGGSVLCASGTRCPRHSTCDPATGACQCTPGYVAVTCAGARCDACPGTDYRCVALPPP